MHDRRPGPQSHVEEDVREDLMREASNRWVLRRRAMACPACLMAQNTPTLVMADSRDFPYCPLHSEM